MKWWGWGDPAKRVELGPEALAMLRSELGEAEPAPRGGARGGGAARRRGRCPAEIAARRRAGGGARPATSTACGGPPAAATPTWSGFAPGGSTTRPTRSCCREAPARSARVLEVCAREGVAVVPFGGGTSVVGGVEPLRRRLRAADLAGPPPAASRSSVDRRSLTATLGPGPARARRPRRRSAAQGVTLGHFPQSFEYATIGGFAATRSAGQASSGYGRFDDLVTSIALTAPAGELRTLETPHTAAGPALRELVVGSEGALGVITEVTARVRPAPGAAPLRGLDGRRLRLRGARSCARSPRPTRSRTWCALSDQAETRLSLALSGARRAPSGPCSSSYLRCGGARAAA